MLADSLTLLFPGTFFILFSSFLKLKTLPALLLGGRESAVTDPAVKEGKSTDLPF
jgi:hypothetical protein